LWPGARELGVQDQKSLLSRVGDIASDLLRMGQTRLELLGVELQLERDALIDRVRLGMFAAVAATLSGVTAMLWIAVVAPPSLRGILLGVLALLWLAIALTATLLVRGVGRRSEQPLFGRVVAQLERDRSTLKTSPSSITSEVNRGPVDHTRPAA
jgi:uncharacterized membrane protein YqjE